MRTSNVIVTYIAYNEQSYLVHDMMKWKIKVGVDVCEVWLAIAIYINIYYTHGIYYFHPLPVLDLSSPKIFPILCLLVCGFDFSREDSSAKFTAVAAATVTQ